MPFVLKLTAFYVAINAGLMLLLAYNVVRMRYRTRTGLGDEGKPEMLQAIRAHANNTEYVPIALILLVVVRLLGGNIFWIHAIGATLTVGRALHAAAFLNGEFWAKNTVSFGRFWGMLLTVASILIGILGCLWLAIAAPI